MSHMVSILFVGLRNTTRSVMAQYMVRARALGWVRCESAGVSPTQVDPLTLQVLAERGMDASEHQPRSLEDASIWTADLVVTMCPAAQARFASPPSSGDASSNPSVALVGMVAPLVVHWDIPDPWSPSRDRLARYRQVRDLVAARVEALLTHGYVEALRERRRRLLACLDRVDRAVVALDHRARVFLITRAASQLVGVSPPEALGRQCWEVFRPKGVCGTACLFDAHSGCPEATHEHVVSSEQGGTIRVLVTPALDCGVPSRAVVVELSALRPTRPSAQAPHGIVGNSPQLRRAVALIRQVARTDYPVLLMGESGTGKELAARAIHRESKRRNGPFVAINCGALPEHILESELFGHVKGAFTGAIRDKRGKFELAHGGTLLLDEVAELSPAFQVKLLRVLQEKQFERVGDERSISVDVRVISSTNRDLRSLVREGRFREDLFYRLAVVPIVLPPLRERLEDLPLLVDHILQQIQREGIDVRGVSPEAMALLRSHPWPGNIRELINALQFASVHCRGGQILPEHLPAEISGIQPEAVEPEEVTEVLIPDAPPEPIVREPLRLTPERVSEALRMAGGNKVKAAKLLGVGRATLYRFLDRHRGDG